MELLLRDRFAQSQVAALGDLMVSTGIVCAVKVTDGLLSKRLDQRASLLLGGIGALEADGVLLCSTGRVGVGVLT